MKETIHEYTLKDLIPLVSAIVVVLGWFITYILNRSQKLHEIFLAKTELNLKEVCGPLLSEMELIISEKHSQSRMRALEFFIKKLAGAKSPLFLESNTQVIVQANALKSAYRTYKSEPNQDNNDFLWSSFLALKESFSSKIKEHRSLLFKHYDWKYKMDRLNPVLRLLCECFRICFVTVTGLTLVGGGLSLITLSELLAKKFLFLNENVEILIPYQSYIYAFSFLMFLIWLFATLVNHSFVGYRIERVWVVKREEKTIGWYKRKYSEIFPVYGQTSPPAEEIDSIEG